MSRLFAVAMAACITAATAPAAFAQSCPCVSGNTLERVQGATELQTGGDVQPGQPISPVAFCGSRNTTNITNARLTAVNTTDVPCP